VQNGQRARRLAGERRAALSFLPFLKLGVLSSLDLEEPVDGANRDSESSAANASVMYRSTGSFRLYPINSTVKSEKSRVTNRAAQPSVR
jgi:hypothetical protein